MSETPTAVTAEHFRYVRERTIAEDAFLRRLRGEAARAGLPPIAISPEQGSLMHILLRLCGAREVVEIGTLYGLSAIWMARALPPGGRVRTVEVDDRHADFAERWIRDSDVRDRIEIHRGTGREVLPAFPDLSADAAFLDADKESYPYYLEECLRILRPGGLVMVDNAFAFGELLKPESTRADVRAMRAFNDVMAHEEWLQSIIIPVGDGMWVGVKVAG